MVYRVFRRAGVGGFHGRHGSWVYLGQILSASYGGLGFVFDWNRLS